MPGRVWPQEDVMSGKYFEDLNPGDRFRHSVGRTVTETDSILFCSLTMNPQPLHLNEDFASKSQFGRRIVSGVYTLGLVVGLAVRELTLGTIIANLSFDRVAHPAPVYPGDTIYVETEVLDKRPSSTKTDRGIVRLLHRGVNQNDVLVCEVELTAMFLRRDSR